jgi:hypothetical protein
VCEGVVLGQEVSAGAGVGEGVILGDGRFVGSVVSVTVRGAFPAGLLVEVGRAYGEQPASTRMNRIETMTIFRIHHLHYPVRRLIFKIISS